MQSLLKLLKWSGIAVVGLIALVILAFIYGSMTPQADIAAKRAAEERRSKQQAERDARNAAAEEAGKKLAKAVLAVDEKRGNRKRIYDAGFDAGKRRAESKQRMPDLSSMNRLARTIIESYGLESEQGDLESQFRAGYSKGFLTGK